MKHDLEILGKAMGDKKQERLRPNVEFVLRKR